MSLEGYEQLKLENQLCFPLYAAAKEVVRKYKPFLDELDLTYTQYIAMMVLWEHESMNVKELGSKLYLDSGTLTPLLKKLEAKGYISRCRCKEDERNLIIQITAKVGIHNCKGFALVPGSGVKEPLITGLMTWLTIGIPVFISGVLSIIISGLTVSALGIKLSTLSIVNGQTSRTDRKSTRLNSSHA